MSKTYSYIYLTSLLTKIHSMLEHPHFHFFVRCLLRSVLFPMCSTANKLKFSESDRKALNIFLQNNKCARVADNDERRKMNACLLSKGHFFMSDFVQKWTLSFSLCCNWLLIRQRVPQSFQGQKLPQTFVVRSVEFFFIWDSWIHHSSIAPRNW